MTVALIAIKNVKRDNKPYSRFVFLYFVSLSPSKFTLVFILLFKAALIFLPKGSNTLCSVKSVARSITQLCSSTLTLLFSFCQSPTTVFLAEKLTLWVTRPADQQTTDRHS